MIMTNVARDRVTLDCKNNFLSQGASIRAHILVAIDLAA